ncbi:hypothetical protein [Erwinia psidii]|uniref:hypothetical protein n=1 Tax=Erwinia psidii TaxID=69224 RepID=UPI0018F720B6|nr:hypothetical protein [Erwinia psidii]
MDTKDDRLLALIGLLTGGLITIVVLFSLTWLSDVRRLPSDYTSPQSCMSVRLPTS